MTPGIQLTEKYQVLPPMPDEQFEALKADIAERGVLTPIDIVEDGHILDGHHRYRACLELGLTDFPTIVRPNMSEDERSVFARKANMLRRHLGREQVRHLIAEQLKETPNWSNSRIGQQLGVDGKTVKAVRERLEATSEIPKFDRLIGADCKERTAKPKRSPAIMAPNSNELERILKLLGDGETAEQIEGFLSEGGLGAAVEIYSPSYIPFLGAEREWRLYILMLCDGCAERLDGTARHAEWICQRPFADPDEWMGEEGDKFRALYRLPKMTHKNKKAWADFKAEHADLTEAEIEAKLDALAGAANGGVWP